MTGLLTFFLLAFEHPGASSLFFPQRKVLPGGSAVHILKIPTGYLNLWPDNLVWGTRLQAPHGQGPHGLPLDANIR
jgi:hypothetical protein